MDNLIDHINKRPPRWFRKTKRVVTILSDTACVMLITMGYAENSLVILWCRVGLSGLLQALEASLVENDEE